MTQGNSRTVVSSQTGSHERLADLVLRYQRTEHRQPIPEHTRQAFQEASAWLADHSGEVLMDAGCGTGQSTAMLAERYPAARVLGLDRSAARLAKHQPTSSRNYLLVRADLPGFWRLAADQGWHFARLYLLYPNPYPKPTQVQRRWHASPAMAHLMAISAAIEVRSNWRTYCEEFAQACALYRWRSQLTELQVTEPLTLFENKYAASAQACWQLMCQPPETHVQSGRDSDML